MKPLYTAVVTARGGEHSGWLVGNPEFAMLCVRFARRPAGTKKHQGWFLSRGGSRCSKMVDSVALAGDPNAYANASG